MSATELDATVHQGFPAFQAAKAATVGRLRGTVLEIGAGRRGNSHLLAPGVSWLGLEPDPTRHRALADHAQAHGRHQPPLLASAERIPLPDGSVDAVLSVQALCSVGDPDAVLGEVARVLAPGGVLVYAEHVAAPSGTWTRRLQRFVAPCSRTFDHGCDPTRDIEGLVGRSPLLPGAVSRFAVPVLFGLTIPYVIGRAAAPR